MTLLLLIAVLGVFSAPAILLVGSAIAGWCFVVAFVGFARRSLTAPSPALAYLSESAFPVYILHQVAIVVPGYFIVQWSLGIAAKFGLLLLVAVAVTLSVYHWLVRPFAVPRFLLGMRPKVCPLRRPIRLAPDGWRGTVRRFANRSYGASSGGFSPITSSVIHITPRRNPPVQQRAV